MAYNLYKLSVDWVNWWNNASESYPAHHIEDMNINGPDNHPTRIPTHNKNDITWIPLESKNFQWSTPMEVGILSAKQDTAPSYLKLTDGKNTFYFYKNGVVATQAYKNGEFYYQFQYALDKYMTYYYFFLKTLIDNKVSVKFNQKFYDRIIYTLDDQGIVKTIRFNYYLQKQLSKIVQQQEYQMTKKIIYSTNAENLWKNNYANVSIPTSVSFELWNGTENISYDWSKFSQLNKNKRYQYLVCNSSALQSVSTDINTHPQGYGDQTKLIIPLCFDENTIMSGLVGFDITKPQPNLVNAMASGNFIGMFECDIPPSLFYGLSKNDPNNCSFQYGKNILPNGTSVNIPFFRIPINFSPKWEIINFDEYKNGMDGMFKNIALESYSKLDPEHDPIMLNTAFYTERYQVDNEKYISTDASLVDLVYDVATIETSGFSLEIYANFDDELHIVYAYGDQNNKLNPIWNNNYSNLRNSISIRNGAYGSATANYYSTNASSALTGISNRKSEESQSWIDYGFNTAKKAASITSSGLFGAITGQWASQAVQASLDIAQGAVDNTMQQERANRSFYSGLSNIASSPSTTASSPFINSAIPNITDENGNTLFQTYAIMPSDWDIKLIYTWFLLNGYITQEITTIDQFDNRQFMNVINVDSSYNRDNLIQNLLTKAPKNLYRSLPYIFEFMAWLGQTHRFYKTDALINVSDWESKGYLANVENILPPLPTKKIDISTIITITELDLIGFTTIQTPNDQVMNALLIKNPTIPNDLKSLLIVSLSNPTYAVISVKENDTYFGNVILTYDTFDNEIVWIDNFSISYLITWQGIPSNATHHDMAPHQWKNWYWIGSQSEGDTPLPIPPRNMLPKDPIGPFNDVNDFSVYVGLYNNNLTYIIKTKNGKEMRTSFNDLNQSNKYHDDPITTDTGYIISLDFSTSFNSLFEFEIKRSDSQSKNLDNVWDSFTRATTLLETPSGDIKFYLGLRPKQMVLYGKDVAFLMKEFHFGK